MKYTGIIMSGDHPLKILNGTKTMTRRTYGLEKVNREPDAWEFKRINNGGIALFWRKNVMEEDIALCKCPYGQVGDGLWVRETLVKGSDGYAIYAVDSEQVLIGGAGISEGVSWEWSKTKLPSIHMLRWASRITLENGARIDVIQAPAKTADDYNPKWAKVGPKWNNYKTILPEDLIWHWDWDFIML